MKNMKNIFLCLAVLLALAEGILPISAQNNGYQTEGSNIVGGNTYYTVTFSADGDSITELVAGSGLELPEDPQKEGYRFVRWVCEGQPVTDGMTVDHDMTITAEFEPVYVLNAQIAYVYSQDGTETVFSSFSAELTLDDVKDGPFTVVSPEYTEVSGVRFWPDQTSVSISESDLKAAEGTNSRSYRVTYKPADVSYTLIMMLQTLDGSNYEEAKRSVMSGVMGNTADVPAETDFGTLSRIENAELKQADQTVTAYYQRKPVILTFDTAGGKALASPKLVYGQPVDLSGFTPEKDGYEFIGWQDENKQPVSGSITLTANKTLTASWEAGVSNYSVVYYKETLSGDYTYAATVKESGITGTEVKITADLAAEGRYTGYEPDSEKNAASSVTIIGDGRAVLPVYYKLKEYTFSFSDDENTSYSYSFNARLGENIADKWPILTSPSASGDNFYGWKSDGISSTYVTKRNTVVEEMLPASGNTRAFTANWTNNNNKVHVCYMLQNAAGNYIEDTALTQDVFTSGSLSAKQISGYTNNTQVTGSGCNENVCNFYYDRDKFVFEYYDGSKELSKSSEILFGADVSSGYDGAPSESSRKFAGWFADAGLTTRYSFTTMPDHNVALYAGWEDPQVTFDSGNGTETREVTYGTAVSAPADPVKAYNSFTGWYTDPESGSLWNFSAPITKDLTLYAHFTPNALSYTVRYLDQGMNDPIHKEKTVTASGAKIGDTVSEQAVIVAGWLAAEREAALTLQEDPDENILTFFYTEAPETITYTVRYLRADDGTPVRQPVTRTVSGDKAIAYEFAAKVAGLFPTQSVKSIALTAGTNEITFYYRDYKTASLTVRKLDMDGDPLFGNPEETHDLRLAESFDGHIDVPGYTWDHAAGMEVFTVSEEDIGKSFEMVLYYRKNLTLTPVDKSKTWDGEPLMNQGTGDVSADGLMRGHSITAVTFSGSQTEVGESASAIESVAIGGPRSGNNYYAITFAEGTLTVNEKAVLRSVRKLSGALRTTADTPIEVGDFSLTFTDKVFESTNENGGKIFKNEAGETLADYSGGVLTIRSGNVKVDNTVLSTATEGRIVINGDAVITLGDLNLTTYKDPTKEPPIKITGGNVTLKTETSDDSAFKYGIVIAGNSNVTLAGVNININSQDPSSAITINPDVTCELHLADGSINSLQGGYHHAGLEVGFEYNSSDPKLTRKAKLILDGTGTLIANGGSESAGIGGSRKHYINETTETDRDGKSVFYGDIEINGGNIIAVGGDGGKGGAGIGSSDRGGDSGDSFKQRASDGSYITYWGEITINGGNIKATGQKSASGIGGGNHCDSGKITINGGTIFAESTGDGSGIGAGEGSSKTAIDNGEQKKGPGYYFADVTINGGDITAQSLSYNGAGIGGGMYSDAIITINGGKINATGAPGLDNYHHGGAGIGGGYQGHAQITITGGEITAKGGGVAAGIGSGGTPNKNPSNNDNELYKCRLGEPTLDQTSVTISGGTIHLAEGGDRGGAGIGGGAGADEVTINITGGIIEKAIGSFSDSSHMLGGAGIGGGADQTQILNSGLGEDQKYFQGTAITIKIDIKEKDQENNKIVAIGGWGASGIGSGAEIPGLHVATDRTNITISDAANIIAYADGTKFAIDTRLLQDDNTTLSKEQAIAGNVLQGTFVHAYTLESGVSQDPEGLPVIKIFDSLSGELAIPALTGMKDHNLAHYRSFAATVPHPGEYLVYTDADTIGSGGENGRYFACSTYDIYNKDALLEEIRYQVETGRLSDNFYLYPVKSIIVRKTVSAPEGMDLTGIDKELTFSLKTRDAGQDGETFRSDSITIQNGEAQNIAAFVNVPDNAYEVWEEPGIGSEISGSFGTLVLKDIKGASTSGDNNNGVISADQWSDSISFENVYETPTPTPETPTPTPETPTPTTETPTPTTETPTPEPPDETDEPEESPTPVITETTPAVTATPTETATSTPLIPTPTPSKTLFPIITPTETVTVPRETPTPPPTEPVPDNPPDPEYPELVYAAPESFIEDYSVPLGLGEINMNAADCFE